jgi:biopolymer transport protein ExbB
MAGETTVTDNPYGIEALWTTSDYVGKGVFVILIVMSLWSWIVMINKWLDQRMLRKAATEAEKSFWTAGSIAEGIGKLKSKVNPFRDIAQDGVQAVEHHRRSTARDVTSNIELADWVRTHIALISISIAGQASLDKVAGPIGEALIMTALGLAVAVPAVLGFNGLLRGNKSLMERANYFAHDVESALIAGSRVSAK